MPTLKTFGFPPIRENSFFLDILPHALQKKSFVKKMKEELPAEGRTQVSETINLRCTFLKLGCGVLALPYFIEDGVGVVKI